MRRPSMWTQFDREANFLSLFFFPFPEGLNVPTPVSRKCPSRASLRNLMKWNDPDEVGWWWVLVLSSIITN